jgi:hypothetical protein
MDKATILSDATRYVKDLQAKLKAHEGRCRNGHLQAIDIESSAVLAKKPRIITVPDDEDGGSSSTVPAATSGGAGDRGEDIGGQRDGKDAPRGRQGVAR